MTRLAYQPRQFVALGLSLGLALSLTGCITLFPKTKPVQLYRFGQEAEASSSEPAKSVIPVLKGQTRFDRASSGDRILTLTGQKSAYIADARWLDSASTLFDAALVNRFAQDKGAARLVRGGDGADTVLSLNLDVRAFEVRYPPRGRRPSAPPRSSPPRRPPGWCRRRSGSGRS